jgi:hypothetical protein
MRQYLYTIILTNGTMEHEYSKWAFNKTEATILAQAEAIQNARGYKLVSITEHKMSKVV